MDLITKNDDERLSTLLSLKASIPGLAAAINEIELLRVSLRAMISRAEAAEKDLADARGQVCRVKEWCNKHGFDSPTNWNKIVPIVRGLLNESPTCARAEAAEKALASLEKEMNRASKFAVLRENMNLKKALTDARKVEGK